MTLTLRMYTHKQAHTNTCACPRCIHSTGHTMQYWYRHVPPHELTPALHMGCNIQYLPVMYSVYNCHYIYVFGSLSLSNCPCHPMALVFSVECGTTADRLGVAPLMDANCLLLLRLMLFITHRKLTRQDRRVVVVGGWCMGEKSP